MEGRVDLGCEFLSSADEEAAVERNKRKRVIKGWEVFSSRCQKGSGSRCEGWPGGLLHKLG